MLSAYHQYKPNWSTCWHVSSESEESHSAAKPLSEATRVEKGKPM
jgi:hypothetical protein